MSDISQKLGFDVSEVLSGLKSADQAINKHVAQLNKLQSAYQNFKGGNFSQATAGINGLGSATQSASQKISTSTQQAQQNVTALGSSFQGLSRRIAFGNVVANAVSQATSSLSEAVSGAVDFQRGLSEIQTIAPALRGDIDGLGGAVRQLSDEFNQPLGNVTEGLYQTISNQVQGTANQLDVLSTSLKFAKVTASSTEEGVGLITAALNGFGKSAGAADTVAAKLFKTIELGRTRASELSNSLGRVSKLGDQIGVSFDEAAAALATITLSGTKTSEAVTQLRGVFNGILKPTERMKNVIEELGFTSGSQAIEVLGFSEALKQIVETAGGSTEALAEMFPRVRGLSGVLNIAGKDADKFATNLEKIQATTAKDLNAAYEIVIKTDAEQATAKINKLKNALVEDFGGGALETFNTVTDAAERLANALSFDIGITGGEAFSAVAKAAPAAAAGIATYAASARAASIATSSLNSSAGALVGRLGAIGGIALVAVGGIQAYDSAVSDVLDRARKGFDDVVSDRASAIRRTGAEAIAQEKKLWDSLSSITRDGIGRQLQEYNRRVDSIRETTERLQATLGQSVSDVFGGRQSIVDGLGEQSQSASGQAESARNEALSAQVQLEDELFNRSLSRNTSQAAFNKTLSRSLKLGREAAEALASAQSPDDKSAADQIFRRATALERQAASIAQQTKSQSQQRRAETALTQLTRERTAALSDYAALQDSISEKASDAAAQQAEALRSLKSEFANLKAPDLFDDSGNPLSSEDRAQSLKDFQADFDKFKTRALDFDGLNLSDFIGLESFRGGIERSLAGVQVESLRFADVTKDIDKQISQFFSNRQVEMVVDLAFQSGGVKISDPADIFSGFTEAAKNATVKFDVEANLDALKTEAAGLAAGISTSLEVANDAAANSVRTAVRGLSGMFSGGHPFGEDVAAQRLEDALNSVDVSLADRLITADELTSVSQKINEAISQYESQSRVTEVDPVQIDAIRKAKSELEQLFEIQKKIDANKATLIDLGSTIGAAGQLQTALTNAPSGLVAGVALADSRISSAITSANNLAQAFRDAAAAAASISVPSGGGDTASAYHGGFIHRAAGGPARGNDNINAVLSRGEYVMNARSARRFAPEISAMNSGSYRASGGSVDNSNNTTFTGDISVNLPTGSTSARDIATSLRREVRRGTSRI